MTVARVSLTAAIGVAGVVWLGVGLVVGSVAGLPEGSVLVGLTDDAAGSWG